MSEVQAKIDVIEAEMARTQKNKATNYHLGTLKAKLAKLRSELINGPGGKSAGTKNSERGFDVTKSGDTRIGLGELCCVDQKNHELSSLSSTFLCLLEFEKDLPHRIIGLANCIISTRTASSGLPLLLLQMMLNIHMLDSVLYYR